MKILPVGTELFYSDRQTGRRDKSNSHFLKFVYAPKNSRFSEIQY